MPFINARIVGVNVCPSVYHAPQAAPRGAAGHIMSPSAIKAFAANPSRWVRGWEPPDSKAKQWGDLVDCRTLTPELFFPRYAVEPETYPDAGMKCPKCESITDSKTCAKCKTERVPVTVLKPWRYGAKHTDAWAAEQRAAGKEFVAPKLLADCDAAVQRLFEVVDGDDTVKRWFDASERQVHVSGQWQDEATGLSVPVRCLLDFAPRADSEFGECLGDFKTTRSAHPLRFQRQAFDFGWHLQSAFDLDLFNAATGQARSTWCFILQENYPPWEPNRAIYGQEGDLGHPGFVQLGREARYGGYEGLMANYCKCLKSGRWPGYNQTDETAQGWCILRPEPFQAERAQYAPQFAFDDEADMPEAPQPASQLDVIP